MRWVAADDKLALSKQCALLGVTRSVIYEQLKRKEPVSAPDIAMTKLLDEEYTRHPFWGTRRMTKYLCGLGYRVNRKPVQRLMRLLGLAGMAPGPKARKAHPAHKIYPYLLRGMKIVRPNQVWSTDITYIRLAQGFMYLVAIIDWYSRKVLSWRLSNSSDVSFCVDCLESAIHQYGKPEIFNSDQGSQFTSREFTGVLLRYEVSISMEGRGRALDNIFVERLWRTVKYEDIYLQHYRDMPELLLGLTRYFDYYNRERLHQSLNYLTPDEVYRTATGGGTRIADKFGEKESPTPITESTGHAPTSCSITGHYLKPSDLLSGLWGPL